MQDRRQDEHVGYLLAVGLTALVAGVQYGLATTAGEPARILPFVAAVLVAAWVGGHGPGFLVTALATVAWVGLFRTAYVADAVLLVLFVLLGTAISEICRAMRTARRRAEARQWALEQEVRERQTAEAEARASEEQLRFALDAGRLGSWQLDLATNRLTGTARCKANVGLPPDASVTYDEILARVHPDDREAVQAAVRRAVADRTDYDSVYRVVWPDGGTHWISARGRAVYDGEGRAVRMVGLTLDVTDRKAAEDALRDREERLRTLSNNLPHGAIYQAVDGPDGLTRFTYISAGIEAMVGVPPAEAIQDPLALYGLIHPDDLPRVRAAEAAVRETLTPFDCEFRHRTRAGGVLWVHCRSAPRRLADGTTVWDGILLDVSARRAAEERFHRLLDANLVGVGISDADGAWREANDELLLLVGHTRADLHAGRVRWDTMTPAEYAPLDAEKVAEAVARGACTRYEKEYVRADGTRVPILIGYAHLADTPGQFVCFVLDLTPQKRVEAALRDADRRKDEFLATLAHELRNPLAPIRTALQVMQLAAADPPAVARARAMMERQVGQMVRLVDDLLDVSRITRDALPLRRERLDLAAAVHAAVETCDPLVRLAGHALTVDLPPEPLPVAGDLARLTQAICNLLSNAARYTEPGGRIALSAGRDGGALVVRVRDTGIGIPPDQLARVWDMFTQVDQSLERSRGGLGIGLTLVKRLVELHGGTVEAHSAGPGRGSEFVLRLPMAKEEGGRRKEEKRTGLFPPSSFLLPHSPKRVLVADDNEDAATSLGLLLSMTGHDIRTAHDGQAALDAAAAFRPDVALLDLGMPKLSGYDVARRIRDEAWGKGVVLVALTGWGQDDDRRRSRAAGFDHHLVKPVDPAALHDLLAAK